MKEGLCAMKKWFQNVGENARRLMQGRYGSDELSRFLSYVSLILVILSLFPKLRFFYVFAVLLLFCSFFRSYSKNTYKRQSELNMFLQVKSRFTQNTSLAWRRWRDRKTNRYYTCPSCRTVVRIPYPGRGKKVAIHCPRCGQRFERKT